MIELRYNADDKLEYRIIKLGGCGSPIEWHEWIVVPNVEKATESSASRGLHTERVTLEITHDGTESVATQKFWDRVLKPDPWFGEHVRVISEWYPNSPVVHMPNSDDYGRRSDYIAAVVSALHDSGIEVIG